MKPSKQKTPNNKLITGRISINSRGVGFVSHEKLKDDVRIEPEHVNTALHGDEVEIVYKKEGSEFFGKVLKVIKRARTTFVGTVEKRDSGFFLIPDDKRMYAPPYIENATEDLLGKKIQIQIGEWTNPNMPPSGKIIKVLGVKGDNNVEMESIVLEKGLAFDFPEEVQREAEKIGENAAISAAEIAARRDFRSIPTFTIDPADAKDFDDALSVEILSDKKWRVGVHIADVSHYVRPGTALDREAVKRGCSIYLVDRTIPMLPHILSDNLCSLNENEEKLTFSAVFTIEEMRPKHFTVTDRWFGKTVIRSHKRFSYEIAQKTLDAGNGEHFKELNVLKEIARFLRAEKFKKGAIEFEQDEVKFELDSQGKPIRVYKKQRLETHKLVEEWMLLANREVAELIFKAKAGKGSHPFIYRIHDLPDRERMTELSIFVRALGYELPIPAKGHSVTAKDLNALLKKIEGKAEESLIRTAAIRSMQKAIYSTDNIGHFGLAFPYYTHFTSPIRRYPDLLVHRMLEAYLKQKNIDPKEIENLEKLARSSTDREIAAADAERTSIKLKQVEFMMTKIGQEFAGVISGVTEWGLYLEEKETKAEGLVRLRDLGDDYYELDAKNYRIVGRKTKKKYTLGDQVRFRITGVDVERKTLDFTLL